MALGQLDNYEGKHDPYLTSYIKIHSRCIIDKNVKGKVKLLEGDIKLKFHDFR